MWEPCTGPGRGSRQGGMGQRNGAGGRHWGIGGWGWRRGVLPLPNPPGNDPNLQRPSEVGRCTEWGGGGLAACRPKCNRTFRSANMTYNWSFQKDATVKGPNVTSSYPKTPGGRKPQWTRPVAAGSPATPPWAEVWRGSAAVPL